MLRHIEMVKIVEFYDGKSRAERLEEITAALEKIVDGHDGIASCTINSSSDSLDPANADLLVLIDFESAEALEDYDMDMDRIGLTISLSDQTESFLAYDYEL